MFFKKEDRYLKLGLKAEAESKKWKAMSYYKNAFDDLINRTMPSDISKLSKHFEKCSLLGLQYMRLYFYGSQTGYVHKNYLNHSFNEFFMRVFALLASKYLLDKGFPFVDFSPERVLNRLKPGIYLWGPSSSNFKIIVKTYKRDDEELANKEYVITESIYRKAADGAVAIHEYKERNDSYNLCILTGLAGKYLVGEKDIKQIGRINFNSLESAKENDVSKLDFFLTFLESQEGIDHTKIYKQEMWLSPKTIIPLFQYHGYKYPISVFCGETGSDLSQFLCDVKDDDLAEQVILIAVDCLAGLHLELNRVNKNRLASIKIVSVGYLNIISKLLNFFEVAEQHKSKIITHANEVLSKKPLQLVHGDAKPANFMLFSEYAALNSKHTFEQLDKEENSFLKKQLVNHVEFAKSMLTNALNIEKPLPIAGGTYFPVSIIDFESVSLAHPEYDLVRLLESCPVSMNSTIRERALKRYSYKMTLGTSIPGTKVISNEIDLEVYQILATTVLLDRIMKCLQGNGTYLFGNEIVPWTTYLDRLKEISISECRYSELIRDCLPKLESSMKDRNEFITKEKSKRYKML